MSEFAGTAALLTLARLRARGRLRRLRRNLMRPKTLALGLLGLVFVAFMVVPQFLHRDGLGRSAFGDLPVPTLLSFLITVFMVTTVLGGIRQGVMAFTPAEVHFLLPAPVGRRALLLAHLLNALLKVAFSAVILAVFLRPANAGLLRTLAGYLLLFFVLVALGLVVDLASARLGPAGRRRRARRVGLALLAGGGLLAVARLALLDAPPTDALAPLGWPAWPFAQLLAGEDPAQLVLAAGLALGALAVLLLTAFGMDADVREAARGTSEVVRRRLEQLGKGTWMRDRATQRTRRSALPMLPALGGAGPHLWRQLLTLSRTRRGLAMLLWMTLLPTGISMLTLGGDAPVPVLFGLGVAMPMFMGSMFLLCDFRSDYDSLAWLRSLPCSPTALAAGQMLGSALVIFALQLVFLLVAFALAEPGLRVWLLAALPLLPALDLLQLSVENGAYLLSPQALPGTSGQPPGAGQLLRFYGLTLAKLLVLLVALAPPGLVVALFASLLHQPLLGVVVGGALLWLETLLAVAVVGRIFLAVDPGRDLSRD